MYAAFSRGGAHPVSPNAPKQEPTTDDLLHALEATVPLSTTRAEEIAQLRAWAKERAVWASLPEAKSQGV